MCVTKILADSIHVSFYTLNHVQFSSFIVLCYTMFHLEHQSVNVTDRARLTARHFLFWNCCRWKIVPPKECSLLRVEDIEPAPAQIRLLLLPLRSPCSWSILALILTENSVHKGSAEGSHDIPILPVASPYALPERFCLFIWQTRYVYFVSQLQLQENLVRRHRDNSWLLAQVFPNVLTTFTLSIPFLKILHSQLSSSALSKYIKSKAVGRVPLVNGSVHLENAAYAIKFWLFHLLFYIALYTLHPYTLHKKYP